MGEKKFQAVFKTDLLKDRLAELVSFGDGPQKACDAPQTTQDRLKALVKKLEDLNRRIERLNTRY